MVVYGKVHVFRTSRSKIGIFCLGVIKKITIVYNLIPQIPKIVVNLCMFLWSFKRGPSWDRVNA